MMMILPLITGLGFFSGGLWAFAGIAGGVLVYAHTCWQQRRLTALPRWVLIGTGLLLGVFILANLQAVDPALSWSKNFQLIALLVPLLGLSVVGKADESSSLDFQLLVYVFITFGVLLGLELFLNGPLLPYIHGPSATLPKYNRGLSYAAMFVWALLAWLVTERRWRLMAVLIVAMAFPLAQTESRATMLAMAAAVTIFALARVTGGQLVRCVLSMAVLGTAGWPFYAYAVMEYAPQWLNHLPASWHARMEIWDYMAARIMERPWSGWGFASSGQLEFTSPHQPLYQMMSFKAGHSHNMVTQWWVELGAPGLLAGLGFCLMTIWSTRFLSGRLQPFALSAWVAGWVLALCAYNAWTDSFLAAMALTSFAFAVLRYQAAKELIHH